MFYLEKIPCSIRQALSFDAPWHHLLAAYATFVVLAVLWPGSAGLAWALPFELRAPKPHRPAPWAFLSAMAYQVTGTYIIALISIIRAFVSTRHDYRTVNFGLQAAAAEGSKPSQML